MKASGTQKWEGWGDASQCKREEGPVHGLFVHPVCGSWILQSGLHLSIRLWVVHMKRHRCSILGYLPKSSLRAPSIPSRAGIPMGRLWMLSPVDEYSAWLVHARPQIRPLSTHGLMETTCFTSLSLPSSANWLSHNSCRRRRLRLFRSPLLTRDQLHLSASFPRLRAKSEGHCLFNGRIRGFLCRD
jgi:hypothetical protein